MNRQRMLTGWRRAARKFYERYPQRVDRVVKLKPEEIEQIERNRRPTGTLMGLEFGRLLVWEKAERRFWWCVCACGDFIKTTAASLLSGRKSDCGCLARERERLVRFREAA